MKKCWIEWIPKEHDVGELLEEFESWQAAADFIRKRQGNQDYLVLGAIDKREEDMGRTPGWVPFKCEDPECRLGDHKWYMPSEDNFVCPCGKTSWAIHWQKGE